MNVTLLSDCSVSEIASSHQGLGQVCAYPATAVQSDGTVVCVYRAGASSYSYDGLTVSQASQDQGQTWSAPVVLFDGRDFDPPQSMIQPVIVAPADGSFLAISPVVVGTATAANPLTSHEGFAQQRHFYKNHSYDGGNVWTPPERVAHLTIPKLGLSGKSFVLPNQELFINAAYPPETGSRVAAACFSSDHGKTIGPVSDLFQDPDHRWNYDEANYTTFPDGTILGLYWTWHSDDHQRMDIQTTAPVHRSLSQDNGRTWSLPQPTNLNGQVSSPRAIDDQIVLVASNYRAHPAGIRLWVSYDRGKTFDDQNVIQMWDPEAEQITACPLQAEPLTSDHLDNRSLDSFQFGLPELHLLHDGSLLLTYWAKRNDLVQVRCCRFRVDLAGKP